MIKKKWLFLLLGMIGSVATAATAADGSLHCLPNAVQMNAQGAMHLGAKDTRARYFLLRNQYDVPLVIDFPEGHTGATAGLTQVLAPRAWAVYVYQPAADELRTGAGMKPPFWTCAKQDPAGTLTPENCAHSAWSCALTAEAAATILSASYQQQANQLTHSFWLGLGDAQYQSVYFLTELQRD